MRKVSILEIPLVGPVVSKWVLGAMVAVSDQTNFSLAVREAAVRHCPRFPWTFVSVGLVLSNPRCQWYFQTTLNGAELKAAPSSSSHPHC